MRRMAITNLVKAGVDLPTIQKISGHKRLAMVMRYVEVHWTHIDDAKAAIDTAFLIRLHQNYTLRQGRRLRQEGGSFLKPVEK